MAAIDDQLYLLRRRSGFAEGKLAAFNREWSRHRGQEGFVYGLLYGPAAEMVPYERELVSALERLFQVLVPSIRMGNEPPRDATPGQVEALQRAAEGALRVWRTGHGALSRYRGSETAATSSLPAYLTWRTQEVIEDIPAATGWTPGGPKEPAGPPAPPNGGAAPMPTWLPWVAGGGLGLFVIYLVSRREGG
jgi:hypothetical protein